MQITHLELEVEALKEAPVLLCMRGYGATAACLTPDQKVGSSNLSGLNFHWQLLGRVLSAAARPARPAALAPAEVRVPQLLLALQLCGSSPCIAA